jgi:hypothetical protein
MLHLNPDGLVLALARAGLVGVVFGLALPPSAAAERLPLEVRETAGLARRGYPTSVLLRLPRAVPAATPFRLLRDGQPVGAQFRPEPAEGPSAKWWLDFQADVPPYEAWTYTVEYGTDVPPGPARKGGHRLTETGDAYGITNAPYITWAIAHDLKGLVRSVQFPPAGEYLRPDSTGLVLRDRQGRQHPFRGSARVVRQGPQAIALRGEGIEQREGLGGVRSTVDLLFPAPVSWVEVDWAVEDPRAEVAALGMQLRLRLDSPTGAAPTLVDFGATSLVYVALRPGQEAELRAGPPAGGDEYLWKVLRGEPGKLLPVAFGPKRSAAAPLVEGWAHVMDRQRCLALAVDAFARDASDRLTVAADGAVTLWREYRPDARAGRKRLRCWLHFVFFPPQHSAATSPQQMQTPVTVRALQGK